MRLKIPTFLTAVLTVLVIFLLLFFNVFSPNKIEYVDSAKLLNGYKAMVEARKEFDAKQATWQANSDTFTNDMQNAGAEEQLKN
jgi:outer membrane protein